MQPTQTRTRTLHHNPTPEQLSEWTRQMPNCQVTAFGAPNVRTKVTARSKESTYLITDKPEEHSDQTLSKAQGAHFASLQEEYLKDAEMISLDGYIGNDPGFRTPVRLFVEKRNANIAGMQQQLYYPVPKEERSHFTPELTVIYTPNLKAPGLPEERLIAVDLENKITRVFNSDYFGESKKGGLRMWNKLVYDRGGLCLHAGAKIIPSPKGERVALIVGLSGTGKTTTTFSDQNGSMPVQDDFLALMPGGKVYSSENGCFAKTFGLDPQSEPAIHRAVNQASSYLENVAQDENGVPDYHDDGYTRNGRATFALEQIAHAADPRRMGRANMLLILNRNEDILPAVARLSTEQAAAYFMLGETKGTSAGGAAEDGKNLRVPGTNPFFPLLHAYQANRLRELLSTCDMEVYLLNTGRVGGARGPGTIKVRIQDTSAIVKALAEKSVQWAKDPDFGYDIATHVPGLDNAAILAPRDLYSGQQREDEYQRKVRALKDERGAYLHSWPKLERAIIEAGAL